MIHATDGAVIAAVLDPIMQSMLPADHWNATLPPMRDPITHEWITSNATDLQDMLTEPGLYDAQIVKNEQIGEPNVPAHIRGLWMIDPPLKEKLARPLADFFHGAAISKLSDTIQETADVQLDIARASGDTFDFTTTLGRIPELVIKKMLNLQQDQEPVVNKIQEALREAADDSKFAETQQKWADIDALLDEILRDREATLRPDSEPKDPIEALIIGVIRNGDPALGNEEIRRWWAKGQLAMLVAAGDETTRALLGNTLQGLSYYGLWTPLKQNPTLITPATEEMARRYPTYPVSRGIAKQEMVIGEHIDRPVL